MGRHKPNQAAKLAKQPSDASGRANQAVRAVQPDIRDETDCVPTSQDSLLSRYIQNLPDLGRLTRSRRAVCKAQAETSAYGSAQPSKKNFDQLSTSDYSSSTSTVSGSNKKRTSNESLNCNNIYLSPTSDLDHKYDGVPERKLATPESFSSSNLCGLTWDSDDNQAESWEEDADTEFVKGLMDSNQGTILTHGDCRALIPSPLRWQIEAGSKVKLSVEEVVELKAAQGVRNHLVSEVFNLEPHGEIFTPSHPAILFIPLVVEPRVNGSFECVYSNSEVCSGEAATWQPVSKGSFHHHNGYVVIQTCILGRFAVIFKEDLPEVRKRIRRRIGGSLCVSSHPGLKITFPRGSCDVDIEASIKILYDSEPPDEALDEDSVKLKGSLACPIIMVGPHGYQFNKSRKPVEIELPVPHYTQILKRWPDARLTIYQSSTWDGEPANWELVEVERLSIHHYKSGLISLSFPTYHFSFFKVVWDILTSNLNAAKLGVAYFYPWLSFPMRCQAYMEENPDNQSFGLEIICFNADSNKEQIQTSNYRYCVGSSLKPKLVKPGRIVIKLRSKKFTADVSAGEEENMEKEEPDFKGRDFEKQFACIFNQDQKVDRGTFGKVIVDRFGLDRQNQKENLFEFNLQKSGVETELQPPDHSDRWSVVAVKELAGHLALTDETNWKYFANFIGFTKQEIRAKLQFSPDPFHTMMNLYQNRGGTPEEFVQALYAVSRELNLANGGSVSGKSGGTPTSTSSGVSGSGSQKSQDSEKQLTRKFSFFGLNPWRNTEDSDSGTADMNNSPADSKDSRKRPREAAADLSGENEILSKKRKTGSSSLRGEGSNFREEDRTDGAWPRPRPKSPKVRMETSSSDESGSEDTGGQADRRAKSVSTERHKRNPYRLSDQDLWQISAHMSAINWRALGRTLGLEESVLVNVDQAHKVSGVRECVYQALLRWKEMKPKSCTFGSLYSALHEERMNNVAKQMVSMLSHGGLQHKYSN